MRPHVRSPGRGAVAVAVMTLLTGCATLERAPPGDGPGDLLAFYHHAGALEPEGMTSAYHRFSNWVRESRCEPDRLRLAMLVMQADSGPGAEADPRAILQPCLDGEDSPPDYLHHLALVLNDRIRQTRRIARLEAERDRLKGDVARTERECRTVEAERDKLKKRVDSLEKQLEALKDIERSIRQRD